MIEFRHGPRRVALERARPFFEELGRLLAGREIVILAGNHDHALVESWLQVRSLQEPPQPLGPEHAIDAACASPMTRRLSEWAAPARLSAGYPGMWIRDDVYATHGHFLDCHMTVPTMERLGIATVGRILRRPGHALRGAADYESLVAPVYSWIDAIAQEASMDGSSTVRAWRALGGPGSERNRPGGLAGLATSARTQILKGGFPLIVAALNRAGLGTFGADISPDELRRSGLRAMAEVADRLGLDHERDPGALHVIFGHTHRAGPFPGEDPDEWRSQRGIRLLNSGCWTYDDYFLSSTPSDSPYWPGRAVLVEEGSQPPQLLSLLADLGPAELRPA